MIWCCLRRRKNPDGTPRVVTSGEEEGRAAVAKPAKVKRAKKTRAAVEQEESIDPILVNMMQQISNLGRPGYSFTPPERLYTFDHPSYHYDAHANAHHNAHHGHSHHDSSSHHH